MKLENAESSVFSKGAKPSYENKTNHKPVYEIKKKSSHTKSEMTGVMA